MVGLWQSSSKQVVVFPSLPLTQPGHLGSRRVEHVPVVVRAGRVLPHVPGPRLASLCRGQGGDEAVSGLLSRVRAAEVQGRGWRGAAALECGQHCALLRDLRPETLQLRHVFLLGSLDVQQLDHLLDLLILQGVNVLPSKCFVLYPFWEKNKKYLFKVVLGRDKFPNLIITIFEIFMI